MASNEPEIFELGEIVRTIAPPRKIKNSEYLADGTYPIVDQSVAAVAGWTEDKSALVHPKQDGLIVFGDHTCVLKFLTEPFAQGADGIKIIEVRSGFNTHYVFAHLAAFPLRQDGYKRHFSELKRLRVRIPNIRIQGAISGILRTLDSKIAANSAVVETLEQIAQTIFKSWFIDFDPVHAKLRGEQPAGMDAETAALFPDSFEESERGLIPSGWKTGTVLDLCSKVVNGSTPSRGNRDFWALGKFPWFKTGELADNFLIDSSECISEMAVNRSSVKVLPKGSVLMAIYAAPTVGRLGILTRAAAFNQACTGMVPLEEVGSGFLYLKLKESRGYFNSLAIGAAQQNISKGVVENCPVTIPDRLVFAAFNELVSPMFSMIENNAVQNANLASIRDALLPRLISGDLEIPDELLVD